MSFDKYAPSYDKHNVIQKIVAKACVNDIIKYINTKLNNKLEKKLKHNKIVNILDIGCGTGLIYKYLIKSNIFLINTNNDIDNIISKTNTINYKNLEQNFNFYAIDKSIYMLDMHPKCDNVKIKNLSYESKNFKNLLNKIQFDIIFSASALQWSSNLDEIAYLIKNQNAKFILALFTSNTFKSIFNITNYKSPILSKQHIIKIFQNYDTKLHNYKLYFDNKKDMFRYIKKSGVNKDINFLKFSEAKKLYINYKLNYLEFEVIYIKNF